MTEAVEKGLKKIGITVSKPALAALCILFGITVILWKESLNIVIGVFLIAEGFSIAHGLRGTAQTAASTIFDTLNASPFFVPV